MPVAAPTPVTVPARGLRFDGLTAGPADGPLVLLLHGFPQSAHAFAQVLPRLGDQGLRSVAITQRGYGSGNRTARLAGYRQENLVRDVLAVADQLGAATFHVVGHDLGGLVAWHLAAGHPSRIRLATILSTPHPAAYGAALLRSGQVLRSAYVPFFQLPVVPVAVLGAGGCRVLAAALRRSGLAAVQARRYATDLCRDGGLRYALWWYRALLVGRPFAGPAQVPVTYVWSDGDMALGRAAAETTAKQVHAPYRFVVLKGVAHWLPEQAPAEVARLVTEQVQTVDGA